MKTIPPSGFPYSGCSDSGNDTTGFWIELTIRHCTQRMRWIPPGRFLMGSPFDEPHRHPSESRHEVTLRKGFWISDTACTRDLWCTITGLPAEDSAGIKKPVTAVSWNDCTQFLRKLNSIFPQCRFSLPTEAQWEYACRTGSGDPFPFGFNVTPEQVNYNGDFPYLGDHRGLNRRQTVDVKSLPVNQWGLYEMHGNVWEWCNDWYGAFDMVSAIDPSGPAEGSYRVLKGGSAFSAAADCRSAARARCHPDGRYDRNGLRFVWTPYSSTISDKESDAANEPQKNGRTSSAAPRDEYIILPRKNEMIAEDIRDRPPENGMKP